MKFRGILIVSLGLMASQASASEWWYLGDVKETSFFFADLERMRRIGDVVDYWDYVIDNLPDKRTSSSKTHMFINCRLRTFSFTTLNSTSADGVVSSSVSSAKPSEIIPDSVGEMEMGFACAPPAQRSKIATKLVISPEVFAANYRKLKERETPPD